MNIPAAIFFVTISIFSVSYGWGMRGTTIGGEKGAMLPGAIMGLLIAIFSGSPVLIESSWYLSALGALGMYFGGCMTYGETLGLSMDKHPAENMKKGMLALFVKGFLWFGIFAATVSMGISVLSGTIYTLKDIAVLFALMPVFMLVFWLLLNKPLNPGKGKYPKIYFSKTRQESWGALFGLLLLLVGFAAIKGNMYTVVYTLPCAAVGGFGWMFSQWMQILAKWPRKNGEFIFKNARQLGLMEPWKIMECFLGGFGGFGFSVAFLLTQDKYFRPLADAIEANGIWSPLGSYGKISAIVWILLIGVDMIQYFIKIPVTKAELKKLLTLTLISKEEYDKSIGSCPETAPAAYSKYRKLCEHAEMAIYAVIPLLLVFLGSGDAAALVSFFIVYIVVVQETCFDLFKGIRFQKFFKIVLLLFGLGVVLAQLIYGVSVPAEITWFMYGVFYEAITLAWILPQSSRVRQNTNGFKEFAFNSEFIAVHGYFLLCVAFMCVSMTVLF
ncbi:MAG: hypothetical protein GX051_00055 [Clostridiales bacterium]|nr:hypothetical protein [Clostridiales bacterium]